MSRSFNGFRISDPNVVVALGVPDAKCPDLTEWEAPTFEFIFQNALIDISIPVSHSAVKNGVSFAKIKCNFLKSPIMRCQ